MGFLSKLFGPPQNAKCVSCGRELDEPYSVEAKYCSFCSARNRTRR